MIPFPKWRKDFSSVQLSNVDDVCHIGTSYVHGKSTSRVPAFAKERAYGDQALIQNLKWIPFQRTWHQSKENYKQYG